ncbi:MAG: MBL fold metallo-hydrolase, partial [Deltaproteobacteria bacterium]|nr:MBL fold metallo-hydrolase [Deltaproteobacteria bacterium]
MGAVTIEDGVYMIGGPEVTLPEDCSVYLLDLGDLVLIDCGAGRSYSMLVDNINSLGLNPARLHTLVLTHYHIDHIGAAESFRRDYGCRIAAHKLDARVIEEGDISMTGADLYGIPFSPTPVDQIFEGKKMKFDFERRSLHGLHTPGHTTGSISLYIDRGVRILFGQEIHGPFMERFGSDINQWRISMEELLKLDADILCEGHFGIYRTKEAVREYIMGYIRMYAR